MNSGRHGRRSVGFTLIELMVVMGLIVLLVGGFSTAVRQTPDQALRCAQLQVASLIEHTRLVAISQQSDTRLVIDAGDSDRFMRVLQIFSLDTTGNWKAAGRAMWLTRGICIVPPVAAAPAVEPWTNFSGPYSVLSVDPAPRFTSEDFEGATRAVYVEYAANGTLRKSTAQTCRITLAGITVTPTQTLVSASSPLRSVSLLANGTVALDPNGLPP